MATVDKVITAPYFLADSKKTAAILLVICGKSRENESRFIFLDDFDGTGIVLPVRDLANKGTPDD
ncbi:hypothetical protein DSCW_26550 [Desulfosarcina widdelii]|uniref:Uncharacterized protein n=1 Tax=Desulfosarcina widdelii TaxID=947919 RepID=A0A5K7Z2P8_9BACT|nr:hypothetical protein DSCW_26550 [Desulfosarcina widdelii]